MNRILWFRLLFVFLLVCLRLQANITVFRYEEEPNEGAHPIAGIQGGTEFLAPFQYIVETENAGGIANREGDVEVTFFNQFGQVLHVGALTHPPFNSTIDPDRVVRSPNLPMLEGRTQLLSWARNANNRPVRFEINNPPSNGTIPFVVRTPSFQCVTGGNCALTFTPPGTTVNSNGTNVTPVGFDLVANTAVTVANATEITTITGQTDPSAWFFGPHVFQSGTDQGDFIFIDSHQGPPDSPNIDFFICQGTATCIDPPLLVETLKPNLNPVNNRFRYRLIFNKLDQFNATASTGSGVQLTIAYHGSVLNNPALFANANGSVGLPGAQVKPESNAFVDSNLLAVRFSQSVSPEVARKTTITGPYAISVGPGTPGVPQVVYPDEQIAFPYGAPVYPSATPFPVKYPFGAALAPGLYTTFTYNFTGVNDGNYEIWISADDFTAASTNNGQSAGSVTPSGGRVAGTTTVIAIIKDTQPPNSFETNLVPNLRVLIVGDQSEPPLPYPTFQGELFDIAGRVLDERQDENQVQVDLRRDDGNLIVSPGKNGHFEQIPTFGGNFFQRIDFTSVDPPSDASPPNPHPAIGGQRGYQLLVYPVDPQLNTAETTRPLYVIKDLQPPGNPVLQFPVNPSVIVTESLLTVRVESPNPLGTPAPFLDRREHGTVSMEMIVVDNSGTAQLFTTVGDGRFEDPPNSSSLLDDSPTWNRAPDTFGGLGYTGVNFFGDVPSRFEFARTINLDGFLDGPITLVIRLLDQVGNPSALTTSITFTKDTTGPQVRFDAVTRAQSGPDDNFPYPNVLGANDDFYVQSLLSPEFTVDLGQGGAQPTVPDPGALNLTTLTGQVTDGITNIDRVEVSSAHVGLVVSDLAALNLTNTPFSVDFDTTQIPESQPEIIQVRARDQNGIYGPVTSVVVLRDIIPARRPTLEEPPLIAFTGKHQVFTSTDALSLSGRLNPQDPASVTVTGSQTLFARVVVLTPSTDPGSFVTGEAVPRLPRTAPNRIPRVESFFSSLPQTAFEASWHEAPVLADGSFRVTVPLSHLPQSASVPTTIWVQPIDAFANTDPDASALPVEIFYFPGGAPLASLDVIELLGQPVDIRVFPPAVLPEATLQRLFSNLESVRFRLTTLIPMVEAPKLSLVQFGAATRTLDLLTSQTPNQAITTFEYSFAPLPNPGKFDGNVQALVSGGRDLFNQSIRFTVISTVLRIDSLAPNLVTTAPEFAIKEIPPVFIPAQGQRINIQNSEISVDWNDFLPSNGSLDRSGVDTQASTLDLFGPLHLNPETSIPLLQIATVAGFDKSFRVLVPLQDGVYRISTVAVDRLQNRHPFYSNFVFDQTPVSGPLLLTNPGDKSVISRYPESAGLAFVDLFLLRLDADTARSGFELINPEGLPVALNTTSVLAPNQLRRFLTVQPALDGSADGTYQIPITAVDKSSNVTAKVHSFLLDTAAPKALQFFPGTGRCVRGPLNLLDVRVRDEPGRTDLAIPVSGTAPESRLELRLSQPVQPKVTPAFPRVIIGDTELISEGFQNSTAEVRLAFTPGQPDAPRELLQDGREDGGMVLKATLLDFAGNQRIVESGFFYDTQPPSLSIADFSEGRLFLTTNALFLEVSGALQDEGPCHFQVSGAAHSGIVTLEVQLRHLDLDQQIPGPVVLGSTPVTGLVFSPVPDFSYHQSQARFSFTSEISGIFPAGDYLLEVTARDQAGNSFLMKRNLRTIPRGQAAPRILFPPVESIQNGQSTTYIQATSLMRVEWELVSGLNFVEVVVRRQNTASTGVVYQRTMPATDLFTEVFSLTPGLTASGIIPFEVLIRGFNSDLNSTAFSEPRTFLLDNRPFFLEEPRLITGNDVQILSRGQSVLATPDFRLDLRFSKPVAQNNQGFLRLRVREKEDAVFTALPATATTDTLSFSGKVTLQPRSVYPTQNMTLIVSDFADLLGQKISGFTTSIRPDFGSEVDLRFFSNPVQSHDLISILRFVSAKGQLEEMPLVRQGQTLVSPSFTLLKGSESRSLTALPIDERLLEGRQVAHSFSIPIVFKPLESGYFFVRSRATDRFGRSIEKETEIRVQAFEPAQSLSLSSVQYGYGLNLVIPPKGQSGSLWIGGTPSSVNLRLGEILILSDLRVFGHLGDSPPLRASLQFSESSGMDFTQTGLALFERTEGGELRFVSARNTKHEVETGRDYVLGKDMVPPQIEFSGRMELVSGEQPLPFQLSDGGSGVDLSSLKVRIGGVNQTIRQKGDESLVLDVGRGLYGPQEMQVEVSDRSGMAVSMSQGVQVLQGEGIAWATPVPSPVRNHQMLVIEYFLNQSVQSATLRIYDAASRLVHTQSQTPFPGKNHFLWDLRAGRGQIVANGVYLFRVTADTGQRQYQIRGKFAVIR